MDKRGLTTSSRDAPLWRRAKTTLADGLEHQTNVCVSEREFPRHSLVFPGLLDLRPDLRLVDLCLLLLRSARILEKDTLTGNRSGDKIALVRTTVFERSHTCWHGRMGGRSRGHSNREQEERGNTHLLAQHAKSPTHFHTHREFLLHLLQVFTGGLLAPPPL